MGRWGTVVLILSALLLGGCRVTGRFTHGTGEKRRIAREEVRDIRREQVELFEKHLSVYSQNGVAVIDISPRPATLFIDGGEYLGGKRGVLLPVGAHEFKAVWSDGRQVVRKVFIEAAWTNVKFDFKYDINASGAKANWGVKDADVRRTRVELRKPRRSE